MGLDIYFYKRQKKAYDPNEKENGEKNDKDLKEVAYFRKVNFLMTFFNYEENCEFRKVEKYEIEDLIEKCEETLELYDDLVKEFERTEESLFREENDELEDFISKRTDDFPLRTTSGFFYGSTEYDEYFRSDVESVLKEMNKLLRYWGKNQEVFMWCWW